MRRSLSGLILFAFSAVLGACADRDIANTSPQLARDSAGIVIVENQGPPRDTAALVVERVLSIGDAASRDTLFHFSDIVGVLRLSTGSVVVTVAADTRWFDASGRYIGTATRRGSGPGEIEAHRASALSRFAGDSVAVTSMQGTRIKHVILSPTGDFLREEIVPALTQGCSTRVLLDLSLVTCDTPPSEAELRGDPGLGLIRERRQLVVVPPASGERHRIGYDIGVEHFLLSVGQQFPYAVIHPFYASSHIGGGGSPMRIALITNPEYSIEVWSRDGRLERIIRRTDGRRAPTGVEREWASGRVRASTRRQYLDRVLAGVPTPDSLPAAQHLLVSSSGEIYVSRFSLDSALYDVFATDGAYVRLLRLPPRFGLTQVDGDYLIGIRRDEDDVPLVEVYRIVRNR